MRSLLLLSLLAAACKPETPDPAELYLSRAFEWGLGETPSEVAARHSEAPDKYQDGDVKAWVFYPGSFLNREVYYFRGDSCTTVNHGTVYGSEVVMLQALEQRVADIRASGVPLVMNGNVYEHRGKRVTIRVFGGLDGLSMNTRRYEVTEAFFYPKEPAGQTSDRAR